MKNALFFVLRVALGALFVYAASTKIAAPDKFADAIANYRILPHATVNFFAIVMPWMELAAGALLVFGVWRAPSALVLAILMAVFTVAVGSAMARGLDIACGCFGTADAWRVGWEALARNAAILAVAVAIVLREGEMTWTKKS
jgi:putative oxidoreductase